jgi:hypothetical protein
LILIYNDECEDELGIETDPILLAQGISPYHHFDSIGTPKPEEDDESSDSSMIKTQKKP